MKLTRLGQRQLRRCVWASESHISDLVHQDSKTSNGFEVIILADTLAVASTGTRSACRGTMRLRRPDPGAGVAEG